MTKREAMEITATENRLMSLGVARADCQALRQISMTLRRWFERECGDGNGCIERDEDTGKAYWRSAWDDRRVMIADRETGARKRLQAIMAQYQTLTAYVQTDPRGCALYILTAENLAGKYKIESIYNRGIAVG